MIQSSKTIGELQAEIEAALSRLSKSQLPTGLEALRYLAPPKGLTASVSLRNSKDNQIKRTADASYWDPQACTAVVSFELEDEVSFDNIESKTTASGSETTEVDSRVRDLVLALDAAERDTRFAGFVGIKAFRDQFLASRGFAWATDQSTRHYALAAAISNGLILRTSIANPNRPDFPTTAVKVNREHPTAKAILSAADADRTAFKPVKIRGQSLSSTVIAERR